MHHQNQFELFLESYWQEKRSRHVTHFGPSKTDCGLLQGYLQHIEVRIIYNKLLRLIYSILSLTVQKLDEIRGK